MILCNDMKFSLVTFERTRDEYGLKHEHFIDATGRARCYIPRDTIVLLKKVSRQNFFVAVGQCWSSQSCNLNLCDFFIKLRYVKCL